MNSTNSLPTTDTNLLQLRLQNKVIAKYGKMRNRSVITQIARDSVIKMQPVKDQEHFMKLAVARSNKFKTLYLGEFKEVDIREFTSNKWVTGQRAKIKSFGDTTPEGVLGGAWRFLGKPKYVWVYKEFVNVRMYENSWFATETLFKRLKLILHLLEPEIREQIKSYV